MAKCQHSMVVHLWVFKFLSELTHVFSGGVNPSSTPFMPPSMSHSPFLTSAAHLGKRLSLRKQGHQKPMLPMLLLLLCADMFFRLASFASFVEHNFLCVQLILSLMAGFRVTDPYVRSSSYSSLGALSSGAFGGLGSPTIGLSC